MKKEDLKVGLKFNFEVSDYNPHVVTAIGEKNFLARDEEGYERCLGFTNLDRCTPVPEPREVYYLWDIEGSSGWYRHDYYINEKGLSTSGRMFHDDWETLNKRKVPGSGKYANGESAE